MRLSLSRVAGDYAVARLAPDTPLPAWVEGHGLTSLTRTEDELSLVCLSDRIPVDVEAAHGWAAYRVDTLANLDEPGVVLAALRPVSEAGLGVFVMSTHMRDYLLVRADQRPQAELLWRDAGHSVAIG